MGVAFAARNWAVFQGASEEAKPVWVLPERATPKDSPIPCSPSGCTGKGPGASLASQLQPHGGMRLRSRLALGPFSVQQRPPH